MPKTSYDETALKVEIMTSVIQSKVRKENQGKVQVVASSTENTILIEVKTVDQTAAAQLIGRRGQNINYLREAAQILSRVGKKVVLSFSLPQKPKEMQRTPSISPERK